MERLSGWDNNFYSDIRKYYWAVQPGGVVVLSSAEKAADVEGDEAMLYALDLSIKVGLPLVRTLLDNGIIAEESP